MPALPPRGAPSQPPATPASSPPPLPPISNLIPSVVAVAPRAPQSTNFQAIPSTYHEQDSSPPPGTVAGIVLGSVGGFLLLLALLYSCTGWTPVFIPWSPWRRRTVVVQDDHHRRHKHRKRRRPRSSRTETEMFEVRQTTSRRAPSSRGRPVPVTVVPQAPAPPPPPPPQMMPGVRISQSTTRHGPPSRGRGRFDDATTATETDVTEDDEVVVIEEHSPPRPKSSRRSSRPRSYDSRRDSRRYDRR